MAARISSPLRRRLLALGSEVRNAKVPLSGPYRDTAVDDSVRTLPTYLAASQGINRSRRLKAMYGENLGDRLVLAWAYGCVAFREVDLHELLSEFWSEITSLEWRYVAVANLTNFEADADDISFPHGLSIRTRSRPELMALTGYSLEELANTVGADWMRASGLAGRFVVLHIDTEPKRPENIVLGNTGREAVRLLQLIAALRLHAAGDVGMSTIFMRRIEQFPIGLGGIAQSPRFAGGPFGSTYRLVAAESGRIASLLGQLDELASSTSPLRGRLDRALARFSSAYDRLWSGADRVIDDMIALEALVGTAGAELSNSLALRTSGLVADDDRTRVRVYDRMRSFYATRSALVHGSPLKLRHQADVNAEEELRDILRRLLRGFLNLVPSSSLGTPAMVDALDRLLLDNALRSQLQAQMAVGGPSTSTAQGSTIVPQWTDQPPSSAAIDVGPRRVDA